MNSITFSIWKPVVENKERGERYIFPKITDFQNLEDRNILSSGKLLYRITVIKSQQSIFLAVESGSLEPRDEEVIDVNSKVTRTNPRSKTELELLKQFFVLFDFDKELLYLSDVRNRSKLEKILEELTGTKIILKGIYEDRDTFLNLLREVDEVSFTSLDNIFSGDSRKRQALSDLLDSNEFTDITLDLKMKG